MNFTVKSEGFFLICQDLVGHKINQNQYYFTPPVFVKCKPTEINKNLHREQGLTENGGYIEPQEQPKHPDDLPW